MTNAPSNAAIAATAARIRPDSFMYCCASPECY
jgi:hypothetical protein